MKEMKDNKMSYDESIKLIKSYFNEDFEIVYWERTLPSFKMGKSKFSNKVKKQEISNIDKEIHIIERNQKINDIIEDNTTLESNCIVDLKQKKEDLEKNKLSRNKSYGRKNKKITYLQLTSDEVTISNIQNEFNKYGINVPMIVGEPYFNINIKIEDVCKFANYKRNDFPTSI